MGLKLDTATAKKVYATEVGQRQPLIPEGMYRGKLLKVTQTTRLQANGSHAWQWQFEVVSDATGGDTGKGAKLTERTGLHESQHWTLKRMFDAFGVKPNVDTDTLIGKEVALAVGIRTMETGARKGQETNDIQEVLPVAALDEASAGGSDDDEWGDDSAGYSSEPDF